MKLLVLYPTGLALVVSWLVLQVACGWSPWDGAA